MANEIPNFESSQLTGLNRLKTEVSGNRMVGKINQERWKQHVEPTFQRLISDPLVRNIIENGELPVSSPDELLFQMARAEGNYDGDSFVGGYRIGTRDALRQLGVGAIIPNTRSRSENAFDILTRNCGLQSKSAYDQGIVPPEPGSNDWQPGAYGDIYVGKSHEEKLNELALESADPQAFKAGYQIAGFIAIMHTFQHQK